MLAPFMVVLPIFGLIFIGYATRKIGIFGAGAVTELNRFVVFLALPALLFDIMAHTNWTTFYQPAFIAVFGLGCAIIFALTVTFRLRAGRPLSEASIDGLNAAYANTGFIGFPLSMVVFGRSSLEPTVIATIITVCVLFAGAIILIEFDIPGEHSSFALLRKVAWSLLKNPLITAPALGGLLALSGIKLPHSFETFLTLLGNAASPCALVALGLFLANQRQVSNFHLPETLAVVVLKLIAQPLLVYVLARFVFSLPAQLLHIAVLLSALPTGTGPFMLAELYDREAAVTSNSILISTILSVFTVSAYLAWIG